jgi:membrane-associated phospholipid phosphatase
MSANKDMSIKSEATCDYVNESENYVSSGTEERSNDAFFGRVWIIAKMYPPHLRVELIFCVIYAALLGKIHYITNVTERPIPYMITSNSKDVIINLSLNHEYITPEEETVPDYLLVLLSFVLPLLIVTLTGIALGYYNSTGRHNVTLDLHSSLCTFLIAFGSTAFFTNFFKYYVGYLRPNFYTMCNYDSATMTCNSNDDNIMREARKAFPSGHASASFCGLLCLGLYLAGKVGLNHHLSTRNSSDYHITTAVSPSRQHHAPWRKFAFLSALGGPLFLSTFVAASRVHDNWHHPADVVAGSLIGASSALVAYHLWYVPNLTGEKKKSMM